MSLRKHLKQCNQCACPPFYVLDSPDNTVDPTFCPYCGQEGIEDYQPAQQTEEAEET